MNEQQGRTWLGSVVHIDIVGSAQLPVIQQAADKQWLDALVSAAVAGVPDDDRIVLDAGGGVALCFLTAPEDALSAAVAVRERLRTEDGPGGGPMHVRIGIHLGPIKVMKTLDGRSNPLGNGLSNAQRVTGFAGPDQILASSSFFEAIAARPQGPVQRFRFLGVKYDEQGGEHPIYEIAAPRQATPLQRVESPSTEMIAYDTGWERAELTAAAVALTPYVGARARILVKEAAGRATSVTHLYRLLAALIPTARGQAEFCRAHGVIRDEAVSDDDRADAMVAAAPAAALDIVVLKEAEKCLAAHVGPVARVLVRKHAHGHPSVKLFLTRLAAELSAVQRRDFLEAMDKALAQ